MKTIAVVHADFQTSPLGPPSRLNRNLRGETIIRRTLQRLGQASPITSIHLAVDLKQEAEARAAVQGLNVRVETHDAGPPPWRDYVRSARKWALDGWRGGLAGTTVYDEYAHPWVSHALALREQADAVIELPADAALLDAKLLTEMIHHFESVRDEVRLTFAQTPPGLSAVLYDPAMLAQLLEAKHPPGKTLTYRPDDPMPDLIMKPCAYPVDAAIAAASGRCLADTDRGYRQVEMILDDLGETADALAISRWLGDQAHRPSQPLPLEIEVELTTADPLENTLLRPRGRAVGRRGPLDQSLFRKICAQLAQLDDTRLILGGFGDPLLCPQWPDYLQIARDSGIFALAVRTPAVHLDTAATQVLIDRQVDLLNVILDAAGPETYRQVHQADHYPTVTTNLDQLFKRQHAGQSPRPLVVCEMLKTHATMDEMERFYDHWLRRTGSAVIAGPSHYAGQWPDLAVMQMAPPSRRPCRRIFRRALILADGRMTVCDQDFTGQHALGDLNHHTLAELWQSSEMENIRRNHRERRYDQAMPLCSACEEWHRP